MRKTCNIRIGKTMSTPNSLFNSLTVASIKQENRDTVLVGFSVPPELADAYRYRQGQYLTLRANVGGEELRRSYSIYTSAQENRLEIAIKRIQGGAFSTWAHDTIRPGMAIEVMPPAGNFQVPLDADSGKHYLAFAAGSGITPIISIIKTTLLAEPLSKFTLFYGNRASSTVIFRDELSDLKDRHLERLKLTYIMSREPMDIDLFNGRIDGAKCEQLFDHWIELDDIDTVFLCGPESMTEEVRKTLVAWAFPKERIKFELFTTSCSKGKRKANTTSRQGSDTCEVTAIIDGVHLNFMMQKGKESVLDAALSQGIDMRYSCKAGVCATCRCKVVEGKVDMDANYALEDYEIARGFALPCQSFPIDDKLILDFDSDH
jgi:ring-1,2-phenylacetyl-CoA epoxidase subunit PaaE